MAKKDRADNLISELDLEILKTLNKRGKYGVIELRNKLNVNPLTIRTHLNRLQELKLIDRARLDKTNRAEIDITALGKDMLNLFDKIKKN